MDLLILGEQVFELRAPARYVTPGAIPSHRLLVCPKSGEIWARWVFEGAQDWIAAYASASSAPPRFTGEVPGSLIRIDDYEIPKFFPEPLVEREFFIHVAYARRFQWQRKTAENA